MSTVHFLLPVQVFVNVHVHLPVCVPVHSPVYIPIHLPAHVQVKVPIPVPLTNCMGHLAAWRQKHGMYTVLPLQYYISRILC